MINIESASIISEFQEPTWLNVDNIKLSEDVHQILLDPQGWLTDEHIDAGQDLLRMMGTGVRGLNSVVGMTHFSKITVATESYQAIQCHNVGNHWLVSTSIFGKVNIYDSLSTNLNNALRQQILHMYGNIEKENGCIEVEVILQQKQKGALDCGLFAIANATCLTLCVDPSSVRWDQCSLREHFEQCLEASEMKMFPHAENQSPCPYRSYKISSQCICKQFFRDARIIRCRICKKRYHFGNPSCIKLTNMQLPRNPSLYRHY